MLVNATGGTAPMTRSRNTPPPSAVTSASTAMPTASNRLRTASNAPDKPKAKMPIRSRISWTSGVTIAVGTHHAGGRGEHGLRLGCDERQEFVRTAARGGEHRLDQRVVGGASKGEFG